MIKPVTISENMMYSTIRIETDDGSGTGFFFGFSLNENKIPIIVTTKHLIEKERKSIKIHLHVEENSEILSHHIEFEATWYFHPKSDICFCFVASLFNYINEDCGQKVFYRCIEESSILEDLKLRELSAVEDVVMVGYPDGLWDEKHNFPLFRKGITSSHPGIDFNGKKLGVIDMACFSGSSGSPLFILNEGGYAKKDGSFCLGKRLIFLGVFCNGYNSTDPRSYNKDLLKGPPLHLGEYVKASEILDFKSVIERLLISTK